MINFACDLCGDPAEERPIALNEVFECAQVVKPESQETVKVTLVVRPAQTGKVQHFCTDCTRALFDQLTLRMAQRLSDRAKAEKEAADASAAASLPGTDPAPST